MTIKQWLATTALTFAVIASATNGAAQVLRYTFDEASGDALDSGVAPLSNGVLTGGAVRSSDTPSGAGSSLDLRTDDPVAYALAADSDDLDNLAAFTLTSWLKVETYVSGNNRIMSKQSATANFDGFSFNMNATTNDTLPAAPDHFRLGLFVGGPGGFGFVFSNADVGAADWTFLATTYDSATNEVAFFIGDGDSPVVEVGTTQVLGVAPGAIDGLVAPFGVGYTDAAPAANTSVLGWQDDVRVYASKLDLAALDAVRLENLGSGAALAADFNNDTKVDAVDFGVWKNNFGTATGAGKPQGDTNADMDVDGQDFLVWQGEFGAGTGVPFAQAVPEPAAGILAAWVLAAVAAGHRRR